MGLQLFPVDKLVCAGAGGLIRFSGSLKIGPFEDRRLKETLDLKTEDLNIAYL